MGWSDVVVSEVTDVQIGGTDGLSPEPSADLSDDQSSEDPELHKHIAPSTAEMILHHSIVNHTNIPLSV